MTRAAWFLLILGLLQMVADIAGFDRLRGLAMATAASPAPRVFCSRDGLETYSTRFFLDWEDRDGDPCSLAFTPEIARDLRGPYNRRNVYGAIIAYGPFLATDPRTAPMYDAVMRYALGEESRLLRELGIDGASIRGCARLRLEPIAGTEIGDRPLVLEVREP